MKNNLRTYLNDVMRGRTDESFSGHFNGSPRIKAIKAAVVCGWVAYKALRAGHEVEVKTQIPETECAESR